MTILTFLGYCTGIMSQIFQGNRFFKQHSPNFDPQNVVSKDFALICSSWSLVTSVQQLPQHGRSKTRIMCSEFGPNCLTSGLMGGIGQLLTLQVLQLSTVTFRWSINHATLLYNDPKQTLAGHSYSFIARPKLQN